MTEQEIFNEAYKRVVKQGRPSRMPDSGRCVYATSDGRRCGVGILMNAKELDEYGDFVGSIVDVLIEDDEKEEQVLRPFFSNHEELLGEIQRAHDQSPEAGSEFVREFKARMAVIAIDNGLDVPETPEKK